MKLYNYMCDICGARNDPDDRCRGWKRVYYGSLSEDDDGDDKYSPNIDLCPECASQYIDPLMARRKKP